MTDSGCPEASQALAVATPAEVGVRLDIFLAGRLGRARAHVQQLVRQGLVAVNGQDVRHPAQGIRLGDLVEVEEAPVPAAEVGPSPGVRRVYEDELLVVVDKPAGMVVHPGPGHQGGTLAQQIKSWGGPWSTAGGGDRPGIVHRLDRGTSGLLVLARSDQAHRALGQQLRSRTMGREYWALAQGEFREDRGRIEAAVSRDRRRPRRMMVGTGGREATTEFTVLERWPGHTALRLRLQSGRTHQIRVHLSYIGRPLAGDSLYGTGTGGSSARPALHAALLHFRHPADGREMTFVSPLPEDLEELRLRIGATPGSRAVWPWEPVPSMVP
ncbi:MAG: RluA family pseudouridine synthase [Candidatus Dormibacteria bacterium]